MSKRASTQQPGTSQSPPAKQSPSKEPAKTQPPAKQQSKPVVKETPKAVAKGSFDPSQWVKQGHPE